MEEGDTSDENTWEETDWHHDYSIDGDNLVLSDGKYKLFKISDGYYISVNEDNEPGALYILCDDNRKFLKNSARDN